MLEVLKVLVPRLMPDGVRCRFVPHEGIKDLELSIPRKLRALSHADAEFVVVRDKHSGNCKAVKEHLSNLCRQGGRPKTLIRIVCHELESWFLGDLAAVGKAYNHRGIAKRQLKAKFRNPDRLANAAQELCRLVQGYQKIGGSRRIAPHMNIHKNKSHSFHVFVNGIRQLVENDFGQP